MNRKKAQQSTLPYSAVEAVLCDVFGIGEDGFKSFRARIRHLRNIGVPRNLPQPGSGRKIQLTLDQILQLAFTLCLEQYGVTPRLAADIGPDIAASIRRMRAGNPHDDFYAVFGRGNEPPEPMMDRSMSYVLLPDLKQLQQRLEDEFVNRREDALLVLNVSNLMLKIHLALQKRSLECQ